MNKRGLGRGLDALIPDTSAFSAQEGEMVLSLPVESIEPNPLQPRREFREEELAALSLSIREQGLLQPVVVRQVDADAYQLIAGERRLRAADRAGYTRIPAIIRDTSDEEMLPLALIENLLREDLNPIEEALAYRELSEKAGWTQEAIAERVGRGRVHVANTLRLLRLPSEIQEDLSMGALSRGHARAVLSCRTEDEMFALRERIVEQGLSVREAEERAAAAPLPAAQPRPKRKKRSAVREVSPETRDLEERLQRVFGTPVHIHEKKGRGRLSLEFYSYDDLARLTDLLILSESRSPLGG